MIFQTKFKAGSIEDVVATLSEIVSLIKDHGYEEGEAWGITGNPIPKLYGPKVFEVEATVEQIVSDDELTFDDRQEGPANGHQETYTVETYTREGAIEDAKDQFHDSIAIKCLDDYEIDFKIVKGSRNAKVG